MINNDRSKPLQLSSTLTENERLDALRSFEILNTPPDGAFDRIVALAASIFKVPISLISLVDEDRIWFQARHGLDATEIPRDPGLCASAIFSDTAYVVKDAINDPRTLTNPLVVGELGLRFYAAAPLVTRDGFRLGTINIIDFLPREFDLISEQLLEQFAEIVMEQLELRLSSIKLAGSLSRMVSTTKLLQDSDEFLRICAWSKKVNVSGRWLSFDQFLVDILGMKVTHGMAPDVQPE